MRVVLTGAAGRLGQVLGHTLQGEGFDLVRTDIVASAGDGLPPIRIADLASFEALRRVVAGSDAVVHLGASAGEDAFDVVLNANIRGAFHLYEAARLEGVRRIVFASSHHVVGYYPAGEQLKPEDPVRPDTLYGVSKCFGEALARLYYDKFGIETAIVRIGSASLVPKDARMQSTWFAQDDLASLVTALLHAPNMGFRVIFGVSDNARRWWSNTQLDGIDWHPRGRAEEAAPEGANASYDGYQGGDFVDRHAPSGPPVLD